ncbi:MAG: toast rack family protein [Candidatus Aminicenantes bacterium]|jgi:hypothetical protein
MKYILIFLFVLIFGLVNTACIGVGETEVETWTIEVGDVESALVELDMSAGELEVHGGARELLDATFTYNVDKWKPRIDYDTTASRGVIKIRQGKAEGIPVGDTENKWDITLSDAVPIDLKVDMGAGRGILDLKDIRLKSLDIDGGVGELKLDISGDRDQDLDVDIDGGIGSATIYLPENTGVKVHVDGGIGSVNALGLNKRNGYYTNDVFDELDHTITIKIDAGIGSIDLKTRSYL